MLSKYDQTTQIYLEHSFLILKGPVSFFLLIWIYSMQGRTGTTRHAVARKKSTKSLKHTGNLFRKNLQLIGVC